MATNPELKMLYDVPNFIEAGTLTKPVERYIVNIFYKLPISKHMAPEDSNALAEHFVAKVTEDLGLNPVSPQLDGALRRFFEKHSLLLQANIG